MNKHRQNIIKAWPNAPLPKFLDKGFADAMVQEGLYLAQEDAHHEAEPHIIEKVRSHCAEYLTNYRYPLCWQFARLPRHF